MEPTGDMEEESVKDAHKVHENDAEKGKTGLDAKMVVSNRLFFS